MASSFTKRFKQLAKKCATNPKKSWDKYRFDSEEAQSKYSDHYSNKAVVVERFLDFDDEALRQLSTVRELERRGWRTFLTQQGQVCEELVREFYSNLKDIEFYPDGPRIYSKLQGKEYMIGPNHFTTILQLPLVAHPDFNYGDQYDAAGLVPLISKNNAPWISNVYPQGELNDEFRILNIVSASSLIPQKPTTDLSIERASQFGAIMTGKEVCGRSLIGDVINSHKQNVNNPAALPFGLFITTCATRDGVKITNNEKWLAQEKPIDGTTLNKSKSQKKMKKTTTDTSTHDDTTAGTSSVDISERMDTLTLSFEQERHANMELREWQRHSMEQEQSSAENWRQYQHHSIDIMRSEVHQMYYNQQQWAAWLRTQWPNFPPG